MDCDGLRFYRLNDLPTDKSKLKTALKKEEERKNQINIYNNALKKCKKELKKIEPHPFFNSNWIIDEIPSDDMWEVLKKNLKIMEHIDSQMNRWPFSNKKYNEEDYKRVYHRAKFEWLCGDGI